jgi:hypothetical protein
MTDTTKFACDLRARLEAPVTEYRIAVYPFNGQWASRLDRCKAGGVGSTWSYRHETPESAARAAIRSMGGA